MNLPKYQIERARQLRREQTEAEQFFWSIVRNRGFGGFKFRRQKPIGRYIVDFYCAKRKLVVEFDGGGHGLPEQSQYDEKRDEFLKMNHLIVKRYWNHQLLNQTEEVLTDIWSVLTSE